MNSTTNRTNLSDLIQANSYESEFEICPGCENHCTVKLFHFQNGNTFFSGNNCEKVYSNTSDNVRKGVNMFAEKYRLLFTPPDKKVPDTAQKIGIPRGLGMYENYPFWRTLFRNAVSRSCFRRLLATSCTKAGCVPSWPTTSASLPN